MASVLVQDLHLEETVNMFKKTLLLTAISSIVVGCASGGGTNNITPPEPNAATVTTSSVTSTNDTTDADNRHSFSTQTFSYNTQDIAGFSSEAVQTLSMTSHMQSGLPAPTEKYKIADYGFLQSTVTGHHAGYEADEESSILNSYIQRGQVKRADLNGDGWQDFYLALWVGDHMELDFEPDSRVLAFINDGDGNFIIRDDLFPEGNPCLAGSSSECSNLSEHNKGLLVEDFNNDGIDDLFQGTTLILSDNGKLYNKRDTHLPLEMFANCKGGKNCFVHDASAGDADNDGDMDVFMPFWSEHVDNYAMPWAMLINDGTGKFSSNQNFPIQAANVFATTAVIGDFDNDGHGDVAVGWMKPQDAKAHGFSQNYENSAGAVFWNDGNNDWRNRAWSELPDNYYGANGNANDMEVIDFNGDGKLDIVLASTKHEPYYDGRMVQFFINNGDSTFTDVTSTYNPNTKYANGINNGYWNGDGQLEILDFDADGDLDIVDTVRGTYVLLNDGDTFTLYDDFPKFKNRDAYYPIEIDNKYYYDFIGSDTIYTDDSSTATFFQVLDPPFADMMTDVVTKPAGYANSIFRTAFVLQDIRQQSNGSKLFAQHVNSSSIVGFNVENDTMGFAAGNLNGEIDGFFMSTDANIDVWRVGLTYVSAETTAYNATQYYGTGSANLNFDTLSVYAAKMFKVTNNIALSVGGEVFNTTTDSFVETGSDFNVSVDNFSILTGKAFADLYVHFDTKFGNTYAVVGADYYQTMTDTKINFADMLEYIYTDSAAVGRVSVIHQVNNFYVKSSIDSKHNNSIEVGFTFNIN